LIDFFTLFYFKYMEGNENASSHYFTSIAQSSSFLAYRGLTFELICQTHIDEIKYALQFYAIEEEHYSWKSTTSDPGAQIDILIKRKDNVDLIVENKFVSSKLEITKAMYGDFARKIEVYRNESKSKNTIFFVLITSFGLISNQYSGIVQKSLQLDDLFVKVQ